MMNQQQHLQECLWLIEQKTGWGNHNHWTHQDFVRLSEVIFEETGINLSSTTLKRIWGKVAYHSFPHITTLNALAHYAGYSCWRAFLAAQDEQSSQQMIPEATSAQYASPEKDYAVTLQDKHNRKHIARAAGLLLLLVVGVLTLLGTVFSLYRTTQDQLATEAYAFAAHPVTSGVPNTVVFHYNAPPADTGHLYIQPAPQQRQAVAPGQHQYMALYYYPGVYQTALLKGEQMVKAQEVLIDTNGWLALVERNPVPLYIKDDIRRQGALGIPAETLMSHYPDLSTSVPWVAYYNVGGFGSLSGNNFTLETELRSDFSQGDAVCQDTSVVILRHHAPPITIPLAITGCLAKVDRELKQGILLYDQLNLPAFGCDFSDWVQVKCEAQDNRLKLWINQQLAYDGALPQATGSIAGILYRFHGTGRVNSVRLGTADGEMVYAEDFEG